MTDALFAELRYLIQKHAGPDSRPLHVMPNIFLGMETAPTPPCQVVVEPVLSLVIQGGKRLVVAKQAFDYKAGQFLVVSVDLPADAHITDATPDSPYLGFAMTLRPEAITHLLLDSGMSMPYADKDPGVGMSEAAVDLLDPIVRMLRLLDRPTDLPVLAASLEREILWRLINGPQGGTVRQIGFADSRISQIARAIRWLRIHFSEPVRIKHLAEVAGMSEASLHRHFRSVTSMTPIQYQKQLRLQEARARLLTQKEPVASVGYAVGYDSPSQFSRDYRRMFGEAPSHAKKNAS